MSDTAAAELRAFAATLDDMHGPAWDSRDKTVIRDDTLNEVARKARARADELDAATTRSES